MKGGGKVEGEIYNNDNEGKIYNNDNTILKRIPQKFKVSAKSLFIFLKDKKIIKTNSKGKFFLESTELDENNLIKLLIHALTNSEDKPKNYKLFYKEMKKFKIPNFLKNNNNLQKYTEQIQNLKWRPPGKLYKKELKTKKIIY